MVEGVGQKIANVMVRNRIKNVFAASLFGDQSGPMKLLEPLRYGCDVFIEFLSEVRHAMFSLKQSLHQLQALG